jgi:hypothetical protein
MKLPGGHPVLSSLLGTLILVLPILLATARESSAKSSEKPGVLFIIVDDMNDWITLLDPEAPIQTPNLERLTQRGVLFTKAYCASPACNPTRTAALTGLRWSTTGVYGNVSDWRRVLPKRKTGATRSHALHARQPRRSQRPLALHPLCGQLGRAIRPRVRSARVDQSRWRRSVSRSSSGASKVASDTECQAGVGPSTKQIRRYGLSSICFLSYEAVSMHRTVCASSNATLLSSLVRL